MTLHQFRNMFNTGNRRHIKLGELLSRSCERYKRKESGEELGANLYYSPGTDRQFHCLGVEKKERERFNDLLPLLFFRTETSDGTAVTE
jgi:hypothetical protein